MLGPRQEPSQVFSLFKNEGGFPTQGLSFMVGVVGSVWTFAGMLQTVWDTSTDSSTTYVD